MYLKAKIKILNIPNPHLKYIIGSIFTGYPSGDSFSINIGKKTKPNWILVNNTEVKVIREFHHPDESG